MLLNESTIDVSEFYVQLKLQTFISAANSFVCNEAAIVAAVTSTLIFTEHT